MINKVKLPMACIIIPVSSSSVMELVQTSPRHCLLNKEEVAVA
jgi:hypothetical protein